MEYAVTIRDHFSINVVESEGEYFMLVDQETRSCFMKLMSAIIHTTNQSQQTRRWRQAVDCIAAANYGPGWPATTYFLVMLTLCHHELYMDHRAEYVVQDFKGKEYIFTFMNSGFAERCGPDQTKRTFQGVYHLIRPTASFPTGQEYLYSRKTNIGSLITKETGCVVFSVFRRNLCRINDKNILTEK